MEDLDECICGHRLVAHDRRREFCDAQDCYCSQYRLEPED